jgi:hypothetical protein
MTAKFAPWPITSPGCADFSLAGRVFRSVFAALSFFSHEAPRLLRIRAQRFASLRQQAGLSGKGPLFSWAPGFSYDVAVLLFTVHGSITFADSQAICAETFSGLSNSSQA